MTPGTRVRHTSGVVGIVVRAVTYGLLVEVGKGDYRVFAEREWVKA